MLSKCGDKIKIFMVTNYGHKIICKYKNCEHISNKIYGNKNY